MFVNFFGDVGVYRASPCPPPYARDRGDACYQSGTRKENTADDKKMVPPSGSLLCRGILGEGEVERGVGGCVGTTGRVERQELPFLSLSSSKHSPHASFVPSPKQL